MDSGYWRDVLLKMKASGINIVATYCIWSLHEEFEGVLSWESNLNLRRFLLLCKELDMKVHLRFSPYCNVEIRNEGLPDWIVINKNIRIRSNDPLYLEYVRRWYQAVYVQIEDKNIRIKNNIFQIFDCPLLFAKSTEGLIFADNLVERTALLKPIAKNKNLFYVDGCNNI